MAIEISLKELIASGAHFGHQVRRWNPKIKPYLYGEKDGVHVFDLTKTKKKLEEALEYLKNASMEGKSILFVGTKKQAKEKVLEVAQATNSYYVNERWLGGTLTNFEQIKRSIKKLAELKTGLEAGKFQDRTKKEKLLIMREIQRLERFFGGLTGMQDIPELVVIVDIRCERTCLKEANMVGVETVGVVDTNGDPTAVDYPIPMNDDATRAIDYVLELIKRAILEGIKKTKKLKNE